MRIALLTVKLYAPWVHSLKEKRMIVKSLSSKLRTKFNISIAETDKQDTHQTIIISIVSLAANTSMGNSILDNVLNFIESNTEAEILEVEREII